MTINCIVIEDELLAQQNIVEQIGKIQNLNLLGVFNNPLEALDSLKKENIDLVFCDIQMPELDGVSFLKTLQNPPKFIFVTADPNFAIESYELNVVDYILKPFGIDRLIKSVNKVEQLLSYERQMHNDKIDRDFLVIKDRTALVIMPHKDIFFLQSDKDYVKISTTEKEYTIYKTLLDLEEELSHAKQFYRVQKSYIINLDYAKTIVGNHIKMIGSIEDIPIGRQYKPELLRRLGVL